MTPLYYGLVISLGRSTQFPPALCEATAASMNCTPRAPSSTVPSFDGCCKLCIEISSGLDPTLRMTARRTLQQNREQTHRYRHRCHGSERRDEVLPDNCYPNLNNTTSGHVPSIGASNAAEHNKQIHTVRRNTQGGSRLDHKIPAQG